MVFASLTFLYAFLPIHLVLYFAWNNASYRNALLILFSLFFYAWGEPVWVVLLVATSLVDWAHALLVERYRGRWGAKAALASSLFVNLSVLAVFKYSGFALGTLSELLGLGWRPVTPALPVGISFYTFQTISYVVDVYRGVVPAQRSPWRFMLFVSLFHQLVAGPIVRYADISTEIDERRHSWDEALAGFERFAKGLFKKVCLANVAGLLVRDHLGAEGALGACEAWAGLFAFTLQIYFDFSGYSDMAIGLGRIFGFHYQENFRHPYIATSATDFWRRWHMSLGTFFRDYVYVPLGGNRRHTVRNVLVVWGLTGLWHGASWNFVLWGLYFGVLIVLEKAFLLRWLEALPRAARHVYLVWAVMMGWALFYETDLTRLGRLMGALYGFGGAGDGLRLATTVRSNALWLVAALLLSIPVSSWVSTKASSWARGAPTRELALTFARGMGMFAMTVAATVMLVGRTYNPFLYYRF